MSFCPKCGKEIGDWDFFIFCGANIKEYLDFISTNNTEAKECDLTNQSLESKEPSTEKTKNVEITNKSKKPLIIVCSVIGILVIIVAVLIVALINNNHPDNTQITLQESKELSRQEILTKAKNYFGNYVSLDNYEPDYNEDAIYINVKDDIDYYENLSRSIEIGNGVTLTLFKTTTIELLNNGFSKGDQTKAINDDPLFARDVYLLYDGDPIQIGEDRSAGEQSTSEIIRYVKIPVEKDSIQFNYSGVTEKSTFKDVVDCLGEPSASSDIVYLPNKDKYVISLNYICDYEGEGVMFAFFNFEYDYKTDSTKLYEVYMNY